MATKAKSTTKPAAKPAVKAVTKSAAKPAAKPAVKPVAKPAAKKVAAPAPKTAVKAKSALKPEVKARQSAALATPTDLSAEATKNISGILNVILADIFALYLKTKNFHWHVSGPHFRDYHLMLDEQAAQLFGMTDDIAERVRKVGGSTLRSIGHIARTQRILDNDAAYVEPLDMLAELREDNKTLAATLREAHDICNDFRDIASASLLEVWIDETERRTWFLFEASRSAGTSGH